MITDRRTGLVTALYHERLPAGLHVTHADLAWLGPAGGRPTVSGASWTSPDAATAAALGEAAERYCGHRTPQPPRLDTWHGMTERGRRAVDPDLLALYRPDQTVPFTGIARTDPIGWLAGTDPHQERAWVPASLCMLAASPTDAAAHLSGVAPHLPVAAGVAAGPTPERARAAALAEVVERHALATCWHAGTRFPLLRPSVPGFPGQLRAVPNLLSAPVVLAVVQDGDGLLGVGCALADDADSAAAKAAAEACQSLCTVRLVADGALDWQPLQPYRPDRRYGDAYAPDLSDATDIVCHAQLLADPRIAEAVTHRLAGGAPVPERHGWASTCPDLDTVLAARGLAALTVDLTTPDVATAGYAVVRVVVPGLRSTAPAAFPFLGAGADPLPDRPCLLPVPHV
ncbi:YcaO-like family protein [Plantactinospora sp. WMMC1484]|uniref:YcaO-like family protein n=1 Tax=Plantactinospora sp. WMMC1484 TaxID=3404122 RepID=UPI003BF56D99